MSASVATGSAAAAQPGVSQGVVISPRVTSDRQPDYTDLGRFVDFFRQKGLSGQDLAIAVFEQLCTTNGGLYHFNEIFDTDEHDYALGNSRDPLRNMNVHNHGFCGIQGPVLEGIFRAAGFEARSFSVPAWDHVATEVFYDGGWHYYDLDLRGALFRKDGVVASAQEARTDKSLWTDPVRKTKPFFPKIEPKSTGYSKFSATPLDLQYHWAVRGWTTDYALRPGETLTRWWRNQGGRWHHSSTYTEWMRKLLEKEPRGIKPNNAEFSIWGVGSALFDYTPDLTDATRDVELGAYAIENLSTSPSGLIPTKAGRGQITFEVLSPYIIVPIMDDLDDPNNMGVNRDAATVMVDSNVPVTAEVSTNGGRAWRPLGVLANRSRFDLTRYVRGRYQYLIRLSIDGDPADGVALRTLELRTWGQVAPISLPRVEKGTNRFTLGVNDPQGQSTRLLPVLPDLSRPEDLKAYGVTVDGTYSADTYYRVVGQAVVPVQAPPGQKIAWLSVGGMFRANRLKEAATTANAMAIATSPTGPFKSVYDATGTVPDWNEHWHYAMDKDVVLDAPAEVVYVRYTGDPGCNAFRIYAHCVDAKPANVGTVRVTHAYDIADERLIRSVEVPASGGSYTIECPAEPTNAWIRLAAPHAIGG